MTEEQFILEIKGIDERLAEQLQKTLELREDYLAVSNEFSEESALLLDLFTQEFNRFTILNDEYVDLKLCELSNLVDDIAELETKDDEASIWKTRDMKENEDLLRSQIQMLIYAGWIANGVSIDSIVFDEDSKAEEKGGE